MQAGVAATCMYLCVPCSPTWQPLDRSHMVLHDTDLRWHNSSWWWQSHRIQLSPIAFREPSAIKSLNDLWRPVCPPGILLGEKGRHPGRPLLVRLYMTPSLIQIFPEVSSIWSRHHKIVSLLVIHWHSHRALLELAWPAPPGLCHSIIAWLDLCTCS